MRYLRNVISVITAISVCISLCACSQNNSGKADIVSNVEVGNNTEITSAALPAFITPDIEDDKNYITDEIIDITSATLIDFKS